MILFNEATFNTHLNAPPRTTQPLLKQPPILTERTTLTVATSARATTPEHAFTEQYNDLKNEAT